MTNDMKLQASIEQLEAFHINLRNLLRIMASRCQDPKYSKYWGQFKEFAYQDMPSGDPSLPKMESEDWDKILTHGGYGRVQHVLRKEMLCLSRDPHYGRFRYPDGVRSGYIEQLGTVQPVISAKAPRLVIMLSTIAQATSSAANEPLELGPGVLDPTAFVRYAAIQMQWVREDLGHLPN